MTLPARAFCRFLRIMRVTGMRGIARLALAAGVMAAVTAGAWSQQSTKRFFIKLHAPVALSILPGSTVELLDASLRAKAAAWEVEKVIPLTALPSALRKGEQPLDRFLLLAVKDSSRIGEAMSDFASDPLVEYVEPEHIYRVDFIPDDSAYASQWGVKRIGMESAWEKTRGSANVIIGVIDTGIDYDHEDLRTQFWTNPAEDANRNRTFEPWPASETRNGIPGDFDGIDNDGNGFVDDVIGYDFVDESGFANAAGGDYRDPDPDVADEMGHGTSVAGIIAAKTNNGVGVAGIAPDCPVMILRAFDARGVGSEGDVTRALAYAAAMGVRVVNMSFGDVQYSRVLRDVIRYCHSRGITMVASAGNSQSNLLHYPSAYDETISVSASTAADGLAGFSNYGTTIDIGAPGQDIITCERFNRYGSFNGTSASAPFVTAVAALVKSLHPVFSPEEIRGVLLSSAVDLGAPGWDDRFGAGLLSASRAVSMDQPSIVKIHSPRTDFGTTGSEIVITGTAASPIMTGFTLQYGFGRNPSRWFDILPFQRRQAIAETLAVWNVSAVQDTTYTIRLAAVSNSGMSLNDQVVIEIDHTAPVFLGIGFIPAVEQDVSGVAVGFITDEPTLGKVWYRRKGMGDAWQWVSAEGTSINNLFINRIHQVYLGARHLSPGQTYELYFSAVNSVGLESTARDRGGANFEITIDPRIPGSAFVKKPYALPLARLFAKTSDFNRNGKPELLLNDYHDDGQLKILEFGGTGFAPIGPDATGGKFPRGIGDANGNGKPELLASFVRKGFLYEATAPDGVPSSIIWADSTSDQFWPIALADVNGDGRDEIAAVTSDSTVGIFALDASNRAQRIASIFNPTGPAETGSRNEFSSPNMAIGDFNANGRTDLLFGDADGDFFIVEHDGNNSYRVIWASQNDYADGSDFLASGDFDGDGRQEFAIGFRTVPDDVIPFWYFGIYRLDAQNRLTKLWEKQFYGIEESGAYGTFTRIQNSLTAGNIDDDPADELVISTYPELYIVDHQSSTGSFVLSWMHPFANTNAVTIGDFDGNGIAEFACAMQDSVVFFERDLPYRGPEPPIAVDVEYIAPSQVRVAWSIGRTAPWYRIWRGSSPSSMSLLTAIPGTAITDNALQAGATYIYAISAFDSTRTPAESPRVFSRVLMPHAAARIDTIEYLQAGQVLLRVDHDMGTVIPGISRFLLNRQREPESVVLLDQRTMLLSFGRLDDGQYGLTLNGLRDGEGIPFDNIPLYSFEVKNTDEPLCFIERVEFIPPRQIEVHFNRPVEQAAAEQPGNYEIPSVGTAVKAERDAADPRIVRIEMGGGIPIGAIGKDYVLKVRNVLCTPGLRIVDGAGGTAGLIFNRQNLEDMFVYPNPLRPEDAQSFVTFANLTQRATIRIYTLSGAFIREVQEIDGNGGVEWNLLDEQGARVPAGVYVYYATGVSGLGVEVEPKTGKFAVIR